MIAEYVVAMTLWMEARGEGAEGIRAVGTVIVNRAEAQGLLPRDVCLQYRQFSCWNGKTPEETLLSPSELESSTWKYCCELADAICRGTWDPLGPWTHYYNPALASPRWAGEMTDVAVVGRHRFGRLG